MTVLPRRRAVTVFLVFALAYFLSALIRAITATLSPTLTQEFGLHARDLGLLAGGYFLGFALTQLPLGTWLDRHGPKKVSVAFLLVAIVGCIAFAVAPNFYALLAARVLCGMGVSACLMAPLTGFRHWLEPGSQLRANSWMLMTGSLGMLASTLPVQWLVPVVGWRPLFWGLAVLVALAAVAIAWQAPAWQKRAHDTQLPQGSYADVWRHPVFRRLAAVGFISYGGMLAIQTLWAGPWLVRVAGHDPLQSAGGLFIINSCMLLAFWCWGLLSPMLARRGWGAERLIATGLPLSFVVMGGVIAAGPAAGAWALAAFCVSATFVSLAQPAVAMAFPAALAGRALSAYNLVIFLGVFAMQWGIGLMVDALRAGGLSEVNAFRAAFGVYVAASMAAYGAFQWARRDNPQERP